MNCTDVHFWLKYCTSIISSHCRMLVIGRILGTFDIVLSKTSCEFIITSKLKCYNKKKLVKDLSESQLKLLFSDHLSIFYPHNSLKVPFSINPYFMHTELKKVTLS